MRRQRSGFILLWILLCPRGLLFDPGQGAVWIGLLRFAPGFVEFDETADGLLRLRAPATLGGFQPGIAGQQLLFGLAVALEFDQARAEVDFTPMDHPV